MNFFEGGGHIWENGLQSQEKGRRKKVFLVKWENHFFLESNINKSCPSIDSLNQLHFSLELPPAPILYRVETTNPATCLHGTFAVEGQNFFFARV